MEFQEWYTTQWITHVADSGGIKATLKLLITLVGALLLAQLTTLGFLVKVLTD